MAAIPVKVKHQGKVYDVELDPTSTGETFKFQLYSLTGVEPDRQKVLVKGGQLKDDTDLSKLNAKAGQTFMMMGTPSGDGAAALVRPDKERKFVEDMTEAEAAQAEGAIPAGLQNLGNTCYLNSTLQVMRAMPELQDQLGRYTPSSQAGPSAADYARFGLQGMGRSSDLTSSLRDLYKQMSETQDGFPPLMFLQTFREVFPQFGERSRTGQGYAQQDAEEAWSQILTQLREKLKLQQQGSTRSSDTGETATSPQAGFVDKFMSGGFESELKCDEAEAQEKGEEPVKSKEAFLKLNCYISKETNHLAEGIRNGLEEKLEKKSASLDREASYTKTSRISRLPKYLTVHFVRFFWKQEAQKKAKIMRKVTFPQELDVVEFCTDELKKRLIPVRDKVREIRKDEEDMVRARKRQKRAKKQEEDRAADASKPKEPLQKSKEKEEAKEKSKDATASSATADGKKASDDGDVEMIDEVFKTDAEYEAEKAEMVRKAKKELFALIDSQLAEDDGANKSGIYELRGIVTHQGASADSGHYTAYVRKQGSLIDAATGKRKEEDGKWWWFNDDKVSEVEPEKIETLSGGGESHSALILLYRAIELPSAEEVKEEGSA